ncbi:RQC-minor-1 family DNA-binding protein [Clostridium sp. FP1]|uniref:RQC-minor-1 family DNA-binding protein n=1 Tax=Clostridium sp. FP1 TaxID=2724076 RepID=UPI0013E98CC7|nr:RQC-minor-1 family DNA-binding protein [Clostridium sp. FP1]MBZ9633696.1 RQC domain protein [Clostridium sp. FP1]
MSRRVKKVCVTLDSKDIREMPMEDIRAIVRGADDLIMSGGRNLLAKILKVSKEKKLLELKLNESPVYGYFKELKIDDILARVDWCIENEYLDIEYDYRLPLLIYTKKGWEIEKDIYSDEFLQKINEVCFTKNYDFVLQLKDRNRELIIMLLDKIAATGSRQYIPVLEAWEKIEYKKVQKKINGIIKKLNDNNI